MVSSGCKPDVGIYTVLIGSCFSKGSPENAEDLILQMEKHGVLPNLKTYNTLIDGYGRMGLMDRALSVFKNMVDAGFEPNIDTYDLLLRFICKMRQSSGVTVDTANLWKFLKKDVVLQLMEEMTKHGYTPRRNTYSTLVTAFCKVDRLEEAKFLFSHMLENGISPNEKIYMSLMDCCCKSKEYSEALEFIDSMTKDGFLPHLESYRLLFSGLCDEGNFEKAKLVFHDLLSKDYNSDEIAWKILVDGPLVQGHSGICLEMFSIMIERHRCPSPQTYARLVKEFFSGSNGGVK